MNANDILELRSHGLSPDEIAIYVSAAAAQSLTLNNYSVSGGGATLNMIGGDGFVVSGNDANIAAGVGRALKSAAPRQTQQSNYQIERVEPRRIQAQLAGSVVIPDDRLIVTPPQNQIDLTQLRSARERSSVLQEYEQDHS